jgi:hypothetical protein
MEPHIDHGRGFIQAPTGAAYHPFDELPELVIILEVHPVDLFLAPVADGKNAQRSVDDDLFDALIVHQRLQYSETENGVEQTSTDTLRIEQQRRIGRDSTPFVRGYFIVDDRADAVLILGAGRQQPPISKRSAHRLRNAVADQPFGGAIARVEDESCRIEDSRHVVVFAASPTWTWGRGLMLRR